MAHIYGVIGFDLAYSQDKIVYQLFTSVGKPMCEKTQLTLSTKLLFDLQDTDIGFVRTTQILEKPYMVGYDKLAEQHGELFLGTRLFDKRVVRSRIAAGLFEICRREGVAVKEIHWFFRTGVPVEYKMFEEQMAEFLKDPITVKQYNSIDPETQHIFVNYACREQPKFAAQSLFYTTSEDGTTQYRNGITPGMTVCAVDCGSQVVNFSVFGPPNLSLRHPTHSEKVGTWSMISEKIRPLLCHEEGIDFADDYEVFCALRTGKIGTRPLAKTTLTKLRKFVFEENFPNIAAGIDRVIQSPRMLDIILLYSGSAAEYQSIGRNYYATNDLTVVVADNPVFVNAEGMFNVSLYHYINRA